MVGLIIISFISNMTRTELANYIMWNFFFFFFTDCEFKTHVWTWVWCGIKEMPLVNGFRNGYILTRSYSKKFYNGSLHPKVQPLTLLYIAFDRKRYSFRIPVYFEKWYPFHIPSLEFCILYN